MRSVAMSSWKAAMCGAVNAAQVLAGLGGELDDAVVHVRDVHDLGHAVALVAQGPAQQVRRHERAEVADVGAAVDGGAADVHADLGRPLGCERLHASAQRVVEAQGHASVFSAPSGRGPSGRRTPAGRRSRRGRRPRSASRICFRGRARPAARSVSNRRSSPNSRSSGEQRLRDAVGHHAPARRPRPSSTSPTLEASASLEQAEHGPAGGEPALPRRPSAAGRAARARR